MAQVMEPVATRTQMLIASLWMIRVQQFSSFATGSATIAKPSLRVAFSAFSFTPVEIFQECERVEIRLI